MDSAGLAPDTNSRPPPTEWEAEGCSKSEIRTKVRTLVSIAASHGSSISSDDLFLLLPRGSFASPVGLEEFVTHDPSLREELVVLRGEIAPKGSEKLAQEQGDQVALTERRLSLARSLGNRLGTTCPWIRIVAISGSTAYGRPKTYDDIDFFIVTRRNRLWITLFIAMLTAKIFRARNRDAPVFCFNRMLEEDECDSAFRFPQDPLFAREALNLRVLEGTTYYRELLHSASWIEELFPALFYRAVSSNNGPEPDTDYQSGRLWSIVNWTALVAVAPYLRVAGLWRNNRLQQAGNLDAIFRTVVRRGFFAYESRKYDLLRDSYRRAF